MQNMRINPLLGYAVTILALSKLDDDETWPSLSPIAFYVLLWQPITLQV